MSILVTGSSGSLGKQVCRILQELKIPVAEFDLCQGQDICNISHLRKAINSDTKGVIHLAAVANLNFFRHDITKARQINIDGTRNVLKVAKENNAWVMFASTCCGYGNNNVHPSDETAPLCPTEPYAKSKVEMEPEVIASDSRNIVMRLGTFYGQTMRPEMAPAIFLKCIDQGDTIPVHGTGNQTRNMIFLDDIANGVCILGHNLWNQVLLPYQIYNITNDETVSVIDMIRYASQAVQKPAILSFGKDRDGQIFKEHIQSNRLKLLGWNANVNFKQGIRKCYAAYLLQGRKWDQNPGVTLIEKVTTNTNP